MKQIRCIDNTNFPRSLIVGKIYNVVSARRDRNYITVIEDDGLPWTYNDYHFEDYNKLRCETSKMYQ